MNAVASSYQYTTSDTAFLPHIRTDVSIFRNFEGCLCVSIIVVPLVFDGHGCAGSRTSDNLSVLGSQRVEERQGNEGYRMY